MWVNENKSLQKSIKACLFDLDGTLLDTLKSIQYYANKNISRYGISTINLDETKVFVGKGARILIEKIFKSKGIDLNEEENAKLLDLIHREYVDDYDSNPLYLTEPYAGICELVYSLKKRGIKLAVISNKPDPTVKQLTRYFFGESFSIIEGASEKMPLKPNPEWPLDICKRLDVKPSEVLYVGDTSTDMKTAVNFGAGIAVGVLWGFRDKDELCESGADVIVEHPKEIAEIIEMINKGVNEI